jgi:dTDP-4-dehydrorhamnose 3,5-epimerase
MKRIETKIPGVYIIQNDFFHDFRGKFLKVFHKDIFIYNKLEYEFQEQFYSISKKNVIRGMHFQIPPFEHTKLVYVNRGSIIDVVLDIRKKSSTFGKYMFVNLSAENNKSIYIPIGCAHGFLSLENDTMVTYLQTSTFSPNFDGGINIFSFGMDWPVKNPIVSEKDLELPDFKNFNSPF